MKQVNAALLRALARAPLAMKRDVIASLLFGDDAFGLLPEKEEVESPTDTPADDGIRVIDVRGMIIPRYEDAGWDWPVTPLDELQDELREAIADPAVRGIILDVRSPGGIVWLVPETAKLIRELSAIKPIYGIADPQAASAGFYLFSATTKRYVTRSGEVGSLGVWTMHIDQSKMLEDVGLKVTLIFEGEHKVDGNPFEPLSDEARANLQRECKLSYDMFTGDVAQFFGVSLETVLADFGQGRCVMAEDALKAGMVDGIATLDEVRAAMVKDLDARATERSKPARKKERRTVVHADDVADATEPAFAIGDRVVALVDHVAGMKGAAGAVNEANAGAPPYYAIDFDEPMGEGNPYKWLNEDEIEAEGAEATRGSFVDIETRSIDGSIAADGKRLTGTALKFGSASHDLGGFREIFEAGAFADAVTSNADDARVIWQHDPKYVFGRVRAGTATITEDAAGIHYTAEPPDAQWARDAMESIRRGDVTQNSFAFIVAEPRAKNERWERRSDGIYRIISKARLVEVGPQTHPAYGDTSVAVRGMRAFMAANPAAPTLPEGTFSRDLAERRLKLALARS